MNMKKVLVINGSRNYVSKGYKIISKIQKGLDSNKFEMVLFDPNKLQLEFCRGCKNCFNTGKCPLDLKDSVTVQTLVLVVNRLYTQPLNLAWGIIVLSSVLIWNMAPVQSINRELDADEKKHCRKVAVKIIVGIYVFAGICTLTGMNAIVSLVAVTMAAVLISQYIGAVKYKIEKR